MLPKRECVCFDVYAASDNEITQMEEDYPSNGKWNIWVIVWLICKRFCMKTEPGNTLIS